MGDIMVSQFYLKNIPFGATEESVSEAISECLNSAPGQTKRAKVGSLSLPDNRERDGIAGFRFVSILTGSLTADEALEALFGLDIGGRKLHVEPYISKAER
jgi:hypothetical protein